MLIGLNKLYRMVLCNRHPYRQKTLAAILLFSLFLASFYTCENKALAQHIAINQPAAFYQGVRAYNHKQYQVALIHFQKALQQRPEDPNLYYYLASSHFKLKHFDKAQIAYQRVIAMAPYSDAAKLAKEALKNYTQSIDMVLDYRGKKITTAVNADPNIQPAVNQSQSVSSADGSALLDSAPSSVSLPYKSSGPDSARLSYGKDNYLEEMTESGKFVRWSVLQQPLKLYVDQHPKGVQNFNRAFVTNVYKAMDIWLQALDKKVTYKKVTKPEEADIRVVWVSKLSNNGQQTSTGVTYHAGITTPYYLNGLLKHMTIELTTLDIDGKPQTPAEMLPVAIHEIGHALGLANHSKNPRDIMYPTSNDQNSTLSARDKNTIRALYSTQVDITNLAINQPKTEKEQKALAARTQKEISALEKLVFSKQADNLDLLNLATMYKDKAAFYRSQGNQKEYKKYINRSLTAITSAIKKEPKYPSSYQVRADVKLMAGDLSGAYKDIQTAIKYNPNELTAWQTKLAILSRMNRPADVKHTQEQMRLKFPNAG